MKRSLFLAFILSVLGSFSAKAVTYLADGVNPADLSHSERFYDTGKGYYWPGDGYNSISETYEQYQKAGNNFSFLGELQNRVPADVPVYESESKLAWGTWSKHLADDSDTCWYQVSANVIQYWQSYYGVFANNTAELPYGLTYDRESLSDLGGTQSLRVGMVFYDNIINDGGHLRHAAEYYFSGADLSALVETYRYTYTIDDNNEFVPVVSSITRYEDLERSSTPYGGTSSSGGYFSDYFPAPLQVGSNPDDISCKIDNISRNGAEAGTLLLEAMGCSIGENGEIVQDAVGQIAYISLDSGTSGHGITCYGFTLGDDNEIKSLRVTNSDDWEYSLFELYVGSDMKLYTDAECETAWIYSNKNWKIDAIGYINTPDELEQMYSAYTSKESNLEWNGKLNSWSGDYRSTTDELPTASTGWEVYVDSTTNDAHDKYYNTYYSENRVVEFGDYGSDNSKVQVAGEVRAAGMELSASNGSGYEFIGHSSGSDKINLTTENHDGVLLKTGDGADTITNLSLLADAVTLEAGELIIGNGAALIAESGVVYDTATLMMKDGSKTDIASLEVLDGGSLSAAVGATYTGSLTLQEGATFEFDLTGVTTHVLDFSGQLTLSGEVWLEWSSEDALTSLFASDSTTQITLIQFDSDQLFDTSLFIVSDAWLMYDAVQRALVLTIPEPATATLSLLALVGLAARRRRK